MIIKDVKRLPVMREIDDIVAFGKRNHGFIHAPNYYGVKTPPPENIKKNWTEFKKECIRLFRADQPEAAQKLVDKVGAIRYTRFQHESDSIRWFVKHADWGTKSLTS